MRLYLLILTLLLLCCPVHGELTVKSISCYPIISNFESLNTANCTILLGVNGANQIIIGQIQGNNLSEELRIKVSGRTEILTFAPYNQGATYRFDSSIQSACPGKPSWCYYINEGEYFIVDKVQDGSYNNFGYPSRASSQILSISIGDTEYSKKIGSDTQAVNFYDKYNTWFANAYFMGGTITGNEPPNQENYVGTYKNQVHKIAHKTDFIAYTKSLNDADTQLSILQDLKGLKTCWGVICDYTPPVCGDKVCSKVLNLINVHNGNLEKFQAKNVEIDYSSVTSGFTNIDSQGNVRITTTRPIAYDELVIILKASSLRIMIPTGTPEIRSINIPNFAVGDGHGRGNVSIQNVGLFTGTFGVRASGASEAKIILAPGQTGSVELYFEDVKQGAYNGEVIVYDINTGKEVKKNFTLNVTAPKNFIPNDVTTYNDVTFKTSNDGMENNITENCDGKVIRWNNQTKKYDCFEVAKMAVVMPTSPPPPKGQVTYPTSGIGFYEYLLVGLIVVILLLYIIEKIINRQAGGLKRKNLMGAGTLLIILVLVVLLLIYIIMSSHINEYKALLSLYSNFF